MTREPSCELRSWKTQGDQIKFYEGFSCSVRNELTEQTSLWNHEGLQAISGPLFTLYASAREQVRPSGVQLASWVEHAEG